MLNYIRAELYKVIRRKYVYITLAILLAGAAFLVWGWALTNSRGNNVEFYFGVSAVVLMLNVGFFATVVTGDMVFSDQYKFCTLKNEVSFGLSRARIYFGKLVVECIVAMVLCAIVFAFYTGLCGLFLLHGETDAAAMELLGYCLAGALPLWLSAQAVTNAALFNIKSDLLASGVVVAIYAAAHNVIKLLAILFQEKLMVLYDLMPATLLEGLNSNIGQWGFVAQCWAVGAVWFLGATLLGFAAFRRKEIV